MTDDIYRDAWDEILAMAESRWEDDFNEGELPPEYYGRLSDAIWAIIEWPSRYKDHLPVRVIRR